MGATKRFTATTFCCMLLLVKPAYAFWPVLDFGEVIPIFQSVTNALDNLSQVKEQLKQLKEGLNAIGDEFNSIAKFGQDLRSTLDDISDVATSTVDAVDSTTNVGVDVINGANNAMGEVNGAHSGITSEAVNQTQNMVAGRALVNDGTRGGGDEPYEEEEEEEEISEDEDVALREDVRASFFVVKEENKKLAEQLNDILNTSLSTINQAAEQGNKALASLGDAVSLAEKLTPADKEILQQRIKALIERRQKLADRNSAVLENAKEAYNSEYKNKIDDGINNYEKAVEQYLRADIDKRALFAAGDKLKQDAASINSVIAQSTITELRQEAENIKKEVRSLRDEIKKMEEKNKLKS